MACDEGRTRLLVGATLWSGEHCTPRPGWLLVDGGRVAAMGPVDERAPVAHETLDLTGCHVLPGFVDVHNHLTVAAWMPRGGDGAGWRRLADALAAVRAAATAAPAAPWLLFWNVSVHSLSEGRLPTAAELDAAAPGRRVLLGSPDFHRGAVSVAALADLGLDRRRARGPYADDVTHDRRGRATGELWEAAYGSALRRALADIEEHDGSAGVTGALQAEVERQLAYGITHAHDPYVPPPMHHRMLELRATTQLRLSWATGPAEGIFHRPGGPAAAPDGPYGESGREVKVFLDGADRCAVCLPVRALANLLSGTTRDAWARRAPGQIREGLRRRLVLRGRRLHTPYLRLDDNDLVALLATYAEAGFRLRLHALGNLAVEQAARALLVAGVPAGTATIDHLTLLDSRTADLLAASGAYASYQPGFLPRYAPLFAAAGVHHHLAVLGGRLLADAGAPLLLSSDQPAGVPDPLDNLRSAVNRRLPGGRTLQPEQALTKPEAVRALTVTAARSLGRTPAGITPGAPADLAVCDTDPFHHHARVIQTWVAGTVAHHETRAT